LEKKAGAATMTAVAPRMAGGPDVLAVERREVPRPSAGQVLIEVAYAGVNRHDCGQRSRGTPPAGATDILGLEVSGRIIETGAEVSVSRRGEEVCALVNGGGYADYCIAESSLALPRPAALDLQQSAAIPEALFTCWFNLVELAELRANDWLLVHGGTSGVGSTAIQLARALGVRVVATAGTAEKCRLSVGLGADRAINYRDEDFAAGVRDVTGGHGADVILDLVGGRYAEANLAALAKDGRVVHLTSADTPVYSAPLRLIMERRARITGSLLRPLELDRKAAIARALSAQVWPLLGRSITPLIDGIYPLHQAVEAHQRMEAGLHAGKILLDPADH
jgi:putative PIG3 family NAD(P)H quinone oxidoreductase